MGAHGKENIIVSHRPRPPFTAHRSRNQLKFLITGLLRLGMGEVQGVDEDEHHSDVIMGAMASQITGVSIAYSTVCSDADQRSHQSSLAFVRGIHRWPVNSPHKGPVTRKMLPFDDVSWVGGGRSSKVIIQNQCSLDLIATLNLESCK